MPSPSALTELDTFPRLLLNHAAIRAERPATREKDLGIWQTWTWSQVADEVRALACGLAAQGFKRGMNLAIIGDKEIEAKKIAVRKRGGEDLGAQDPVEFIARLQEEIRNKSL